MNRTRDIEKDAVYIARAIAASPGSGVDSKYDEETGYTSVTLVNQKYGIRITKSFYSRFDPENSIQECITRILEELQLRIIFAEQYIDWKRDNENEF